MINLVNSSVSSAKQQVNFGSTLVINAPKLPESALKLVKSTPSAASRVIGDYVVLSIAKEDEAIEKNIFNLLNKEKIQNVFIKEPVKQIDSAVSVMTDTLVNILRKTGDWVSPASAEKAPIIA